MATIHKQVSYANQLLAKSDPFSELKLKLLSKTEWVYAAASKYRSYFKDKLIAVVGSSEPWCEAIAIALDARKVVSIEYNFLTYTHPKIETISSNEFSHFYETSKDKFDLVFSISSFDHSGLGRYGDPIDPHGDLKGIGAVSSILKPGGLLVLTVPIGPDLLVYNCMRIYGKVRLEMLLSGWNIIEILAWDRGLLTAPVSNWRKAYEPVFILQKPYHNVTTADSWSMLMEHHSFDGVGEASGDFTYKVKEL